MGKGYKRKTRWRTLNFADCPAAPPGDKDDENGTCKSRENGTRSNGQSTRKSSLHSRSEQKKENGVATSDSASASLSHSQTKFTFDENEYTRITTPRQDVLFKKGYLSRKVFSTSATPSTTESQSASHSTADGSETMEDQQLLDSRDNGIEIYPSAAEPTSSMNYGTFYDPASGYCYEYPMVLMGPPIPGPPMPEVLATMPCQPVPLRPIQWINPAFVPSLDQQYCFVDYQNLQGDQQYEVPVDENIAVPTEHTNGTEEIIENGNGNTIWTESVASGEQPLNDDDKNSQYGKTESEEVQYNENYKVTVQDDNFSNEPPLETALAQQLHVSHHVLPPIPQPYVYPGHYMFGPALVNCNGMTVQNGQMMRTSVVNTWARKKKKTKYRKTKRPGGADYIGNYGPEEEYYSSEAENVKTQTSVTGTNIFVLDSTTNSCPLNPDCEEFVFKGTKIMESQNITPTEIPITLENDAKDSQSSETTKLLNHTELSRKSTSIQEVDESTTELPAVVTNIEYAAEAITTDSHHTNGFCEMQDTEIGVDVTCPEFNDIVEKFEENCVKLSVQNNSPEMVIVGECDRLSNGPNESRDKNENQRLTNHENLSKNNAPKNKYKDGVNLIFETTPESKLDKQNPCTSNTDIETHIGDVPMGVDAIEAQIITDTSNEDSGFESQTRFSDHPITDAVTQWLRCANSPELFVTPFMNNGIMTETDMEDDELDDNEPSKNLQGNPMPALSVNSIVNDVKLMSSRTASCGEFARVNNCSETNKITIIRKKKKRSGNGKKKMDKSVDKVSATDEKTSDNSKINRRQQRKKSRATARLQATSLLEQKHDICEFTEKDSDAGMRVATNTRINFDNVQLMINNNTNDRRMKSSPDAVRNRIDVDIDHVKTFEQGEIVVSVDGKLLPNTIYGGLRLACNDQNIMEDQLGNASEINSIGSIEEPDMLECWEAETVESINTKKLFKDRELYQTDEIDDIHCTKVDVTSLELVRKYYTLARGSVQSFSSIEDGVCDTNQMNTQSESKLLMPQRIIETLYCEPIPSVIESSNMMNKQLPIDESIEVYESCYTGQKPPILITPNFYKSHLLRDEDGPIPCKAACCMIQ